MITKNSMVCSSLSIAPYHFALRIGHGECKAQSFTRNDINSEKLVMTGSITLPDDSCDKIPPINCSLTINLMRKVVDVERMYQHVDDIVKLTQSLEISHRYQNDIFEDFTFFVKGQEFKVNKQNLALFGDKFAKVFDQSKNDSYVDDKTDPKAFETMLEFLYGLDVDFNVICANENADSFFYLIEAARTYGVKSLRAICIAFCLLNFTNNLKELANGFKLGTMWTLFEYRDYCREVIDL